MNKCYKNVLAIASCLTVGSVINTGSEAVKNTFKAYAGIYGGFFSVGAIRATKIGYKVQKTMLEQAKRDKDLFLELLVTRWGKGHPVLEANCLVFNKTARTIPKTLPPFVCASVVYHAYKNADINF